jgi:hypothetical protein
VDYTTAYSRCLRYAAEQPWHTGSHAEERAGIGEFARAVANGDHTALLGLADHLTEIDHPLAAVVTRAASQDPATHGHRRTPDDGILLHHPDPLTPNAEYEYPHLDFGGTQPPDVFEDRRPYTTAAATYHASPSGNHRVVLHFGEHAPDVRPGHPYRFREYAVPTTPEEMEAVVAASAARTPGAETAATVAHLRRVHALLRGDPDPSPPTTPDRGRRPVPGFDGFHSEPVDPTSPDGPQGWL